MAAISDTHHISPECDLHTDCEAFCQRKLPCPASGAAQPKIFEPPLQIISPPFGRVGMGRAVEFRLPGSKNTPTPHPPSLWKSFFAYIFYSNKHEINSLQFTTSN
jgi:hypothetical protein